MPPSLFFLRQASPKALCVAVRAILSHGSACVMLDATFVHALVFVALGACAHHQFSMPIKTAACREHQGLLMTHGRQGAMEQRTAKYNGQEVEDV